MGNFLSPENLTLFDDFCLGEKLFLPLWPLLHPYPVMPLKIDFYRGSSQPIQLLCPLQINLSRWWQSDWKSQKKREKNEGSSWPKNLNRSLFFLSQVFLPYKERASSHSLAFLEKKSQPNRKKSPQDERRNVLEGREKKRKMIFADKTTLVVKRPPSSILALISRWR